MLHSTAIQDWHKLILEIIISSKRAVSPQLQPSIKLERLHELEAMCCVDRVDQRGASAYLISDRGLKYSKALESGDLFNPQKWYEDVDLAALFLCHGDVRDAIPYIVDGLNLIPSETGAVWTLENKAYIHLCLMETDNGYAHVIADIAQTEDCNLRWIPPQTMLAKKDADGKFSTINLQLSPLAEEAFTLIETYIREKHLRTFRMSKYTSKAMVCEYALILAAALIDGTLKAVPLGDYQEIEA